MSRRALGRVVAGTVLVTALITCAQLGWDDYMDAGYDAFRDGRFTEAEGLLLTALDRTGGFAPDDLRRATTRTSLADLYVAQARHGEAEVLYRQAAVLIEQALGPAHPDLAAHLVTMAEFYIDQEVYSEAEPLYERSVAILEASLGGDHPDVGTAMADLGSVYRNQGLLAEAEPLFARSLVILEAVLEPDNVRLADVLEEYAALLRATSRGPLAAELEARVRAIRSAP